MINGRLLVAWLIRRNFSNFAVAKMKPRIGVLTTSGDCPGLNAVLRAVVLAADKLGWEVVGFRDGLRVADEGHFGSTVSYQNYQVRHVPIAEAVNRLKLVPRTGNWCKPRETSTFPSVTDFSSHPLRAVLRFGSYTHGPQAYGHGHGGLLAHRQVRS
jgi:hypothetical protein